MKATAHQQTPVSPTRPLPTVTSGRLTATLFLANTMAGYTASGFFLSQDNGYQPPTPPVSNGETISDAGWCGADVSSEPSTDKDDDDGNGSAGNSRATHPDEGQVRTDEHVRHHQPVRFGVMLRYRLDRRWSLESGLTYSRLTSDFTQTTGKQMLTTEQKLTFIGIPLNVGYQLWTSRRFSVYASAGGMAEKMVKGSSESRRWTSKTACQDLPLKDLKMHRLQFSVNGALGMDYRLSRLLCLYAEPGISYYFDNGSSLSTIYRDKPLNFSLNLGIRLQLPDFRRESGQ
jgi:hypothetical protein